MKRLLSALAATLMLLCAAPAFAADANVRLTLDGRPVDKAGGVALVRNGVIYADVVPLVKSFDGLLTFQGTAVVVTINGVTGRFTTGSRTALINDGAVTMPGQTFTRNGDIYVPLEIFITRIAKAKLRTNPARTHADIFVNASPS
jgi:hypothetical protein